MSRGNTTRERLLEAAIAAIEAGGEASLRVDDIADAAGITKPSLYHFFGSREGLVAAALAEYFRRLIVIGLEPALDAVRNAENVEEFASFIPLIVKLGAGEEGARRRAARIAVLGSAVTRPQVTEEICQALLVAREQLAEFIRIGKARGFVPADRDPDAIATWWYAELTGRHLIDLVDDPHITEQWEELTTRFLRVVLIGD